MTAYEDPWTKARQASRPGPCRYGCGKRAWLIEPGGNQVAHKVCADAAAGVATPDVTPIGDLAEGKVADRALGCGTPPDGHTTGRVCAADTGEADRLGTTATCQLCPASPTYWRKALSPDERAALPPYAGPVVTAEPDSAAL
jgi:hypothetical protein